VFERTSLGVGREPEKCDVIRKKQKQKAEKDHFKKEQVNSV
jgi:hypothetical protein